MVVARRCALRTAAPYCPVLHSARWTTGTLRARDGCPSCRRSRGDWLPVDAALVVDRASRQGLDSPHHPGSAGTVKRDVVAMPPWGSGGGHEDEGSSITKRPDNRAGMSQTPETRVRFASDRRSPTRRAAVSPRLLMLVPGVNRAVPTVWRWSPHRTPAPFTRIQHRLMYSNRPSAARRRLREGRRTCPVAGPPSPG